MNSKGFALVAALWVITLLSSVVGVGITSVRLAQAKVQNRVEITRGFWAAEACASIAISRWRNNTPPSPEQIDLGRFTRCSWSVVDLASRVNINTADSTPLNNLFRQLGLFPDSASALAGSIVATAAVRRLTDLHSIIFFPGFDRRVLDYLTVDGPGVVNPAVASEPVLRSLPGFGEEVVREVLSRRRGVLPIETMDDLMDAVSPTAREAIEEDYRDLTRSLAFESAQFVLMAEGWVQASGPYPRASVELLVAPLPDRIAVLRKRVW